MATVAQLSVSSQLAKEYDDSRFLASSLPRVPARVSRRISAFCAPVS